MDEAGSLLRVDLRCVQCERRQVMVDAGAGQLFISYSRRDREFVERLNSALVASGRDAYVDWEDIPAWSPDYERELLGAIDGCDAFLFVISADSISSENCRVELERAVTQGKRIRPLLQRQVDVVAVPEALRRPQWIDFSRGDAFDEAVATLVESVDVDADWVREHTRLGVRATEWEGRSGDKSLLLRGRDLRAAEAFLAGRDGKEPAPTQLHTEFVAASRRSASRRQRVTFVAVLIALVGALVLAALAFQERNSAISKRNQAVSLALAAAADRRPRTEVDLALRLSLEANRVRATPQATSSMLAALLRARRSGATTVLRAHQGAVASVAFSPDGQTLVSGGGSKVDFPLPAGPGDGSLRMWSVGTLRPIGPRLTGRDLESGDGIAFSPDGHMLAGLSGGSVQLWDLHGRTHPGARFENHDGVGWGVAFSPDGHTVAATVGQNGAVELWDVRNPRKPGLRLLDRRLGITWCLAFSPDGRTLAAGGYNGLVRLWDVHRPSAAARRLRAGTHNVWAVAYSPDGRTFAAATDDGVHLWKLRRGRVGRHSLLDWGTVLGLAFSPDSGTLVAASGGDVLVYDLHRPGRAPELLEGHDGPVLGVAFSPDGHTFASAGGDGTVRLWDTRSPPPVLQPARGSGNVSTNRAVFSPDGHLLALTAGNLSNNRSTVRLWDVRERARPPRAFPSKAELSDAVAFSPDGRTLAYGGDDGNVRLLGLGKLQRRRLLHGPAAVVSALAFAPDGHTLASATGKWITLFDPRRRGSRGPKLRSDQGVVLDLTFSRDGKTLASAGVDGSIVLWDLDKRSRLARLLGDGEQLNTLAFSRDGHTLAAGDEASKVWLWDVRKHTQIGRALESPKGVVKDVAFAPDGVTLVAAYSNGSLRFWDLRTQTQISALKVGDGSMLALAVSPNGHTLTSADNLGAVVTLNAILWRDFDDLKATVCRLAPVDLTKTEWDKLAPGMPQQTSCSN